MTTPADPIRPATPTVGEIAALTARLREISARGRDVDEAQRAAFLADKDSLIARITATTDQVEKGTWEPGTRQRAGIEERASADRVPVGRVDARFLIEGDRFDHDGIVHVVDDTPVEHDGRLTVPTRAGEDAKWVELPVGHWVTLNDAAVPVGSIPEMHGWMREQAGRADTEFAARGSESADRDDPVEIAERVGQLRAEHGPSSVEATISRAEAARQLTERGYDPASAQSMVTEYLHETSREVGVPVYQWGLDGRDVAAIAADYQWVDHHRGETLAQARGRAAEYATGWAARAGTVDRERSPGYASHAQTQAAQWASRATTPEPFTHPDLDAVADVDGDPWEEERAHEQAFDGLCERHPLPGDGPGDWVTDGHWTRWDDGVVVDDDATDPEITFAPSDIWDDEPVAERGRAGAEWDAVRGDDPRSYSTMMGDAARALGSAEPAGQGDALRREQLARWHADDQTTEKTVDVEQVDGAPVDLGRG